MTLVNKIELFRTTFRNAFPMSTAKLHVSPQINEIKRNTLPNFIYAFPMSTANLHSSRKLEKFLANDENLVIRSVWRPNSSKYWFCLYAELSREFTLALRTRKTRTEPYSVYITPTVKVKLVYTKNHHNNLLFLSNYGKYGIQSTKTTSISTKTTQNGGT